MAERIFGHPDIGLEERRFIQPGCTPGRLVEGIATYQAR